MFSTSMGAARIFAGKLPVLAVHDGHFFADSARLEIHVLLTTFMRPFSARTPLLWVLLPPSCAVGQIGACILAKPRNAKQTRQSQDWIRFVCQVVRLGIDN